MDNVIVYKTNPESLQAVLGLLRKEGFNPATLEDPALAPVRSGGTHSISITVPGDEAAGAGSVLRKWEQANQSEIEKTTRKLVGPFLLSVTVAVVLAIIFLFLGTLLDYAALLFVIWLVVFALLAKVVK